MAVNLGLTRKRSIRATKNSLDRCTIVSVYPKDVLSHNVTVFPGRYIIPAGTVENPGIVVVTSGSYFKDDHQANESIEVIVSSVDMATSIIADYVRGLESAVYPIKMPGIFFVEGAYDETTIKKHPEFAARIQKSFTAQEDWYRELVRTADVSWARTGGNPRSISNDARRAAEHFHMKEKPWMQDFKTMELSPCPACGHLRNAIFPICANCGTVIDKAKYAALGLTETPRVETKAKAG